MSTKSHIICTSNNESSVYFDCVNQWKIDGNYFDELTFELSKKDIRIDCNDDEDLVFSLHKDSELYRELYRLFSNR